MIHEKNRAYVKKDHSTANLTCSPLKSSDVNQSINQSMIDNSGQTPFLMPPMTHMGYWLWSTDT